MNRNWPNGFSLIELLVVVAIIGVLAAIGTIGYGNYITQTQIKVNATNLDNMAQAIQTKIATSVAGLDPIDGDDRHLPLPLLARADPRQDSPGDLVVLNHCSMIAKAHNIALNKELPNRLRGFLQKYVAANLRDQSRIL